jgi:hypothetical protein
MSLNFDASFSFLLEFAFDLAHRAGATKGGLRETSPLKSSLTKLGYSEKKKMRANILVWKQVNREK